MNMYSEESLIFAWLPILLAFILGAVSRIIQSRFYTVKKHVGGHVERIFTGNGKLIPFIFMTLNTVGILLIIEAVLYTLIFRLIINQ